MDVDKQLFIVDEVPEDDTQVGAAVDTLVGEGCNIIFGISFGYLNEMEVKAEEYPDVIFSHATGFKSNETNYNNYFGRIYQARYLAGLAGWSEEAWRLAITTLVMSLLTTPSMLRPAPASMASPWVSRLSTLRLLCMLRNWALGLMR